MGLRFKAFDSDNADGIVEQINRWMDKNPEEIDYIDLKITSESKINGSNVYLDSSTRVHAILIYKEV